MFEVGGTDGELTLNRITLRNGNPAVLGSEDGGAILVNAGRVLAVSSSNLAGNTAQEGGAIASLGGSSTTISSTVVSGNVAFFGGGGLYNLGGSVTARSSIVSDNNAHHGSGIHNLGTLNLQSSVVRNNSATLMGGVGGGVYNTGTATISSSSVQKNTAGIGGGLFNLVGSMTVNFSSISGNTAENEGGGIRNYATLGLNSTSLSNNKVTAAGSQGGGLYNGTGTATLTGSLVTGNSAVLEAGGIFENPGSTVNLVSSFVSGNTPDNCRPPGPSPAAPTDQPHPPGPQGDAPVRPHKAKPDGEKTDPARRSRNGARRLVRGPGLRRLHARPDCSHRGRPWWRRKAVWPPAHRPLRRRRRPAPERPAANESVGFASFRACRSLHNCATR